MVLITDGKKTFSVTAGAVSAYKSLGFRVITEEECKQMQQSEDVDYVSDPGGEDDTGGGPMESSGGGSEDDNSEEDFVVELLEKPLSQWTGDEMKEFVRIKGIDTTGAQKVSQVRPIIKAYLEQQQKESM